LPTWAILYPKMEIFDIFGAGFPPSAPIEVKFCTTKRTHVFVGHAMLHVNHATSRPCGAKNLIFGLWVNLIPAACASRTPAGNNRLALYTLMSLDASERMHAAKLSQLHSLPSSVNSDRRRTYGSLHRLRWNFAQPSGPACSSATPCVTWIGATSRPYGAKNLIFGLWVNLIPAACASRNPVGNNVTIYRLDLYTLMSLNASFASERMHAAKLSQLHSLLSSVNSDRQCQ